MRILLAVDGSDHSYEAARALTFFSAADEVILLHTLDVPKPAYPQITPEVAGDIYATVERDMRAEGERLLATLASALPANTGPVTRRLEVGKPPDAILSVAREQHIDLILLGTRGIGPVRELVLGSVSHHILSHAPCPVLAVRRPLRSLDHILLPVQGPEDAEAAIRFCTTKPFREPVDVTVLTVVSFAPPPWPADASVTQAMKNDVLDGARYFVDDVASRLSPDMYRAKGAAILGAPVEVIQQEAARTTPDLILMGSRGRHGLTRFMLGSVSHSVLHQATCPVLVFPWPGV